MARIETYPFDTAITPNDYVIGTDGDSLNATKNYKVSTMLGYLGNMFNLQSQDLYYTYNAVASGSVGSGEVSSNNYADGTILTSGVTNLYVSKLTELAVLVDTYLNAIATDQLAVIVMDLSAPENYIIFQLTGSSDVDANTINLAGTVTQSNGELVQGRSIGLKLTAASDAVDLSGYVTIDTIQDITGRKTFQSLTSSQVNFENTSNGRTTAVGQGTTFNIQAGAGAGLDFRVNGDSTDSFYVFTDGSIRLTNLAGTGDRMVVANATGVLSTQAVPSGARTAFATQQAATGSINVGAGLGTVDVGGGVLFPTDTRDGDVFHIFYTVSWSPRNGKSFDEDNVSLDVAVLSGTSQPFNRLDNGLLSLSGNISMSVHIMITVLDAVAGDWAYLLQTRLNDFITTGQIQTHQFTATHTSTGDLTDGTRFLWAQVSYADDAVSEGTLAMGAATFCRAGN